MELKKIKIIVSESDGVLTDGQSFVDTVGATVFKSINHDAFELINILKKHFKFVFMSNDPSVTASLCRSKNIPFFWAQGDKHSTLLTILRRYNFSMEEVLYVGSSISDLGVMKYVPSSICTFNSPDSLYEEATDSLDVMDITPLHSLYTLLSEEINRREREVG